MKTHRVLALALVAASFAACRRETPAGATAEPKFDPYPGRVPTMGDLTLLTPTPGPEGLVAAVLTPLAARPVTPVRGNALPPAPTPASSGPIVWARDTTRGYTDAVEFNKPMVVVFGEPGGRYFEDLLKQFDDPALAALSGYAVWIQGIPSRDVVARNIATALGIEKVPTISVLEPDPEMISEALRIEGFEEAAPLAQHLRRGVIPVYDKFQAPPTPKP